MNHGPEGSGNADLLLSICLEWDHAEADIKLAEQVGLEVVIPAINELRYAGRRVIDAVALPPLPENHQKLKDLFNDSRFFCHRARHDAIDAAVSLMVENLETMMITIGPSIVMSCYSDFAKLRMGLHKVQMNIVESRKNRENRAQIYKTISECDFSGLVNLHSELQLSEPIMLEMAEAQRRERRRNSAFGWGGIIFGFVCLVVAVVAWKYPHLLGG